MRLKKVLFINRAPFNKLELDFDDSNVFLLSGINGKGKTTILSYIVDAFYELAKKGYRNEFEKNSNKYYRVSSGLYSLNRQAFSIVYLRFITKDGKENDYIDIHGNITEEEYCAVLGIDNPIPFSNISKDLEKNNNLKYWRDHSEKASREIFSAELMTYFPAYRYEQPYYLNTPYKPELEFSIDMGFAGYLENPIEVTTDFPKIANWMMDVVLDSYLYKGKSLEVFSSVNSIISLILRSKTKQDVRLGIGQRYQGAERIAVMSTKDNSVMYPSIFLMSSGEMALVAEFVELLKQADALRKPIHDISGIVLIDEVDKHLHIRLQKEILPLLFAKFPNVQFVVTSHAPFLSLGLAENNPIMKSVVFDMDRNGCRCEVENNDLYQEVYQMMIAENDRFADKYKELSSQIKSDNKPLIITEGKTDWKHIKAAMKALNITDIDVTFHEYEGTIGDKNLMQMLKDFVCLNSTRKIIGIFDRDNDSFLKDNSEVRDNEFHSLGANIYAFAIPVANEDQYGSYTSIEHYYIKDDLLKEDVNGRRLFLGSEFYESGNSKDRKYQTKFSGIQNKVKINGVIDEKVYDAEQDPEQKRNIALSKNDYAQLIYDGSDFAENFDFSHFRQIFQIIRKIIELS